MPVGDEPTSDGIPAHRRPFGGQHLNAWRTLGGRRTVLTNELRDEIRQKYAEASESDPALTRNAFSISAAPEYGVTAAAIRNVLYS